MAVKHVEYTDATRNNSSNYILGVFAEFLIYAGMTVSDTKVLEKANLASVITIMRKAQIR